MTSRLSTTWITRINTTAAEESNRKSSSKSSDDSFPLVVAKAIGTSAFLVGSAAILYMYYNRDMSREQKGRTKKSRARPRKEFKNSDTHNDSGGNWGRPTTPETASSNDEQESTSFELPQHLQRELYKEERRKASIRFLAMKKPLYENIEMYAPDGETMLCTIGTKKAKWYVRKELAVWRENPDVHKSIRLLFEPKNSKNCKINQQKLKNKALNGGGIERADNDDKLRQYNCTHKLNICVSCGAKDVSEVNNDENNDGYDRKREGEETNTAGLMRHYVVPYAYRKLLPTKFKTHLPHDIVLLCLSCHIEAEQAAKTHRADVYEKLYRKDPSTRLTVVVDQDLKRIKSYARALWQHKDKLPAQRIEQYESAILEHLARTDLEHTNDKGTSISPSNNNRSSEERISFEVLRELANLQPERKNPKYIPLADLVVQNLCHSDETISKFVVSWREFFVETLRPRHLPAGWSVHSPVEVDIDPQEHDRDDDEAEATTANAN